jgi:GntR family transcriptional regulator, transcriptional repressor for pyruvate dehydrogenase complex
MTKSTGALPEKIAADLTRRILGDEFAQTRMLPSERALQESYDVSRTVIREALKLLAARGLVNTSSGQGAMVATNLTAPAIDALLLAFHRSNVRLEDVLHLRMLIEPLIAGLAASHATPLQIRALHELVQEMAALAEETTQVRAATYSFDNNARFHMLLAQASQNPALEVMIEMIVGVVWRQQHTVREQDPPAHLVHTAAQHGAIVAAIEAHDQAAASAAMTAHLTATHTSLALQPGVLQTRIWLRQEESSALPFT